MPKVEPTLDALCYKTETGQEPVRTWLLSLTKMDRKIVGTDLLKVQYCWPIGMPLVRSLGKRLWEVRSRLEDRIARVIFHVSENKMLLLHGFIKKTQKTPSHELEIALKRLKQWM